MLHAGDDHETDQATPPDAPEVAPEAADDPVVDALGVSLGEMREEADRIAGLGTGTDQVEAAERFADGAGRLDEQIGAAGRAPDHERERRG